MGSAGATNVFCKLIALTLAVGLASGTFVGRSRSPFSPQICGSISARLRNLRGPGLHSYAEKAKIGPGYMPPMKKKKRVKPAPLDEEEVKVEEEEKEMVDPELFRVTIEEGLDGNKVIVPPKLNPELAELPPEWEIIYDENTGKPYYYNKETGKATQYVPEFTTEKVALKKNDKPPTTIEVETAKTMAKLERENLMEQRYELDRLIIFKRDVLENLEKELARLEEKNDELTASINKIAEETPEERIAREKQIEEEKRAAKKKEGIDPDILGVFGVEKARANKGDRKGGLFPL